MNTEELNEKIEETQEVQDATAEETSENVAEKSADEKEEEKKELTPEEKIAELEKQLEDQKKSYVYLMADFDNFRKRTLVEKNDLLKYGGSETLKKLLPVIDDFERAMDALEKSDDINGVKEGINLIYTKFKTYLEQNNLTVIPAAMGDDFNDDIHEAMTMFPAPTPELKGKIVDCVTKGYKLNDKVIRYAKVVVGQ
ncbi:MAG: nucleotide exchange factor GrpE [Bacteroidales bacterium]|nr:nucleotide exchange factor GrpE [Bacteroidales bacterium]